MFPLLPFDLLALAICAVWLPPISVGSTGIALWMPLLVLATAAAGWAGIVQWPAALALAALSLLAWGSVRSSRLALRAGWTCIAAALALLMALHWAPGFLNPMLFDGVRFSADAAPFTQYLNFDKGAAGLIFLAAYANRARSAADLGRVGRVALAASVGTSAAALATALALGYVRPDLKVPAGTPAFLATNLFFTCVAEEVFFRGLIQERLAQAFAATRVRFWLPVGVSAGLFGVAHVAGGAEFAALATVAGVGYALAYALTRRIEAAIVTHFAVNLVQFIGFTYPQLAK